MDKKTTGRACAKTSLIAVRIEASRKERLDTMAADLGVSPSELIRNLLHAALVEHGYVLPRTGAEERRTPLRVAVATAEDGRG